MYVYYPSCNFTKAFPETARRVRAYLKTQDDVRIAGCCHTCVRGAREGGAEAYHLAELLFPKS